MEKIGLGTWAFGGRAYGPMEDDVARAVVRRALELGITFFDTANIYGRGRSEEILGECQGIASSFPELAIRFVVFHPPVSKVIPGAKSVSQLEQNVQAVLNGPLPGSAIRLINELREVYLPKLGL